MAQRPDYLDKCRMCYTPSRIDNVHTEHVQGNVKIGKQDPRIAAPSNPIDRVTQAGLNNVQCIQTGLNSLSKERLKGHECEKAGHNTRYQINRGIGSRCTSTTPGGRVVSKTRT